MESSGQMPVWSRDLGRSPVSPQPSCVPVICYQNSIFWAADVPSPGPQKTRTQPQAWAQPGPCELTLDRTYLVCPVDTWI